MSDWYLIDVPRMAYETYAISVLKFDEEKQKYILDSEATEELGRKLEDHGYTYSATYKHIR